jgi:hypothetical protein
MRRVFAASYRSIFRHGNARMAHQVKRKNDGNEENINKKKRIEANRPFRTGFSPHR